MVTLPIDGRIARYLYTKDSVVTIDFAVGDPAKAKAGCVDVTFQDYSGENGAPTKTVCPNDPEYELPF